MPGISTRRIFTETELGMVIQKRGYAVMFCRRPCKIGEITPIIDLDSDQPFRIIAETDFADWNEQRSVLAQRVLPGLPRELFPGWFYRLTTD